MGPLRLALLAFALALPAPAAAGPLDRWAGPIAEASARFGIPEAWVRRVMLAESGGRTMLNGRLIESRAGAMGLMQLMPATWREMRAAHGLGADPHDPRDNILAGTAYLRAMYDRFGYPGLFAAYNAGPARYSDHLATGRKLPPETVAYVSNVAGGTGASRAVSARAPVRVEAPAGAPIFAVVGAGAAAPRAAGDPVPPTPASLFVQLTGASPP